MITKLISSSVLNFGDTAGVKSIVFPEGFTNKNCHVVPIPLGTTPSDFYGIKLSPDQTTITTVNIKGTFAATSVKIYFIKLLLGIV